MVRTHNFVYFCLNIGSKIKQHVIFHLYLIIQIKLILIVNKYIFVLIFKLFDYLLPPPTDTISMDN